MLGVPERGREGTSRQLACNCRLTSDWKRAQLFYILQEIVGVDICVVAETWLGDSDNVSMQGQAERAGFKWTGIGRMHGKGGGVGVLVKKHLQCRTVSKFAANVLWIEVDGIGRLAGVYAPPVGSSSHDPPFAEILNALAAGVRAAGKQRSWILGEWESYPTE